jgi:glycosyltransferase involved in cell wall biosynthesis
MAVNSVEDLVSIVVPTYNSQEFIADSIRSVLAQSYRNFEIIIVDDCSFDKTVSLVHEFEDGRIRIKQNESNCGPADTRNNGLELASGRYIAFLDSDDLWGSEKLAKQIAFMEENKVAFSYTRYDLIDEHGGQFGDSGPIASSVTYKSLLPHCIIRTSSVIYDTTLVGGKVYFPPLRKRQDFGLFLRLLKICDRAFLLDEELCSYRIRRDSVSSNKLKNIPYTWALYRNVENMSIASSAYYLSCWFFNSGFVNVRRLVAKRSRRSTPHV